MEEGEEFRDKAAATGLPESPELLVEERGGAGEIKGLPLGDVVDEEGETALRTQADIPLSFIFCILDRLSDCGRNDSTGDCFCLSVCGTDMTSSPRTSIMSALCPFPSSIVFSSPLFVVTSSINPLLCFLVDGIFEVKTKAALLPSSGVVSENMVG